MAKNNTCNTVFKFKIVQCIGLNKHCLVGWFTIETYMFKTRDETDSGLA